MRNARKHEIVLLFILELSIFFEFLGRRSRDSMIVGFTSTYAISAYHD
jgi:hypothetical protein